MTSRRRSRHNTGFVRPSLFCRPRSWHCPPWGHAAMMLSDICLCICLRLQYESACVHVCNEIANVLGCNRDRLVHKRKLTIKRHAFLPFDGSFERGVFCDGSSKRTHSGNRIPILPAPFRPQYARKDPAAQTAEQMQSEGHPWWFQRKRGSLVLSANSRIPNGDHQPSS